MPVRWVLLFFVLALVLIPRSVNAQRADVRVGTTAVAAGGAERFVPGQLLVRFKTEEPPAARAQTFERVGGQELRRGQRSGLVLVAVPQGVSVNEVAQSLRADPRVALAVPNPIVRALETPNDQYFNLQWHLQGPALGGINATQAWDLASNPGSGVVVAVVDSGVAFESATRASYQFGFFGSCVARGDVAYMKAPDLAGTAFVPGRDFVCTATGGDDSPNDDNSHGTHVAGTIAQTTNNSVGVAGVARGASIMPIKVLDNAGNGNLVDLIDGLYWAVDNGARVINLSLGFDPSLTLSGLPGMGEAFDYAYSRGVTVVAAAGNNGVGTVGYPAAYRTVIAVGATRIDRTRTFYSNYGSAPDASQNDGPGRAVDVMAPGGDTQVDQNGDGFGDGVLQNTFNPTTKNPTDFSYYFLAGTSMASPHVAGAAAVLLSRNSGWGPDQVRAALQSTAQDLGAPGPDAEHGYGLINLHAALGGAGTGTPTPTGTPAMATPPGTSAPSATATATPTRTSTPIPTATNGPAPTQVAFDGFESGNGTGGTGWSGPWTFSGGSQAQIITGSGPQSGTRHLRLLSGNGAAQRSVQVPATLPYVLSFGAKINSFEASDQAHVTINGVRQKTFTAADSDNVYRTHVLGLDPGATTILFDAAMSATNDFFYIDNVEVKISSGPTATGTPVTPAATSTPLNTQTPSRTPTPTFTSTPSVTPVAGVTVVGSPTSVTSGGSLTVSWVGIPSPSTTDWVGMYAPGAADNNHVRYQFTGGGSAGSMAFTVPPSVFPGSYELRLFSNNTTARLAVGNTFAVTACPSAVLSSTPMSVPAGGVVNASFSGVCYPTSIDWIALHNVGSSDLSYRAWVWSGGGVSGNVPLTVPSNAPPGQYELRMYANNTSNRLAVGNTFTVTVFVTATATTVPTSTIAATATATAIPTLAAPTATPTSPPVPTATSTPEPVSTATATPLPTETATPAPTDAPTLVPTATSPPAPTATSTSIPTATSSAIPSNTPVPPTVTPTRTPTNTVTPSVTPVGGVTLVGNPTSVISGGSLTVSWSGIPSPSGADWIAMSVVGAPDNSYVRYQYTGGGAAGSIAFAVPSSVFPGSYEFRLFSNNSSTRLATSNPITVIACPSAALSSTPLAVAAGGVVQASWSGVCYPSSIDWIALHNVGTSDLNYRAWVWSGGGVSGSAPLTIPSNAPPGQYELRMYANNTSNRLAVGNTFTVTAP